MRRVLFASLVAGGFLVGDVCHGQAIAQFVRGDANADERIDLTDGVFVLNFLFSGTDSPPCMDAADADDSGRILLTDAVYLLANLFSGGPNPAAPFPECGIDDTDDDLECALFAPCPPLEPEEPELPEDEVGERVYIYRDNEQPLNFIASGWMPDGNGIEQNLTATDEPQMGSNFVRLRC